MTSELLSGHGLWAAWTLAELGPVFTFPQQVFCEAGYLNYLWTRHTRTQRLFVEVLKQIGKWLSLRKARENKPQTCGTSDYTSVWMYLSTLIAALQHQTLFPVVKVQSIFCKRFVFFATENAHARIDTDPIRLSRNATSVTWKWEFTLNKSAPKRTEL